MRRVMVMLCIFRAVVALAQDATLWPDAESQLMGPITLLRLDLMQLDDSTGKQVATLTGRIVNTLDGAGHMLQTTQYAATGSVVSRTVYTYTGDGLLTEETQYGTGLEVTGHITYMYDKSGLVNERDRSDARGHVFGRDVYSYSQSRRKLMDILYIGSGDHIDTINAYSYDWSGKVWQHEEYWFYSGLRTRDAFTYSDLGLTDTQSSYDSNGVLNGRESYYYNAAGQCVEVRASDPNGVAISVSQYRYDSRGNWVEKTLLSRSGPSESLRATSSVVRTIQYEN